MIPVWMRISGFLSYRDSVELDFTGFDLACISGPNGAGKSSLLDAITWALFGQARKRDDSVINSSSKIAEVQLIFDYEHNRYQVIRANPRGQSIRLEFHIQNSDLSWKPLTDKTNRETQARIQEILRLDYDTFINASFFLQGKADQFTQQRAGDRKRILASILGLEVWESYRRQAVEARKAVETEIAGLDGRLAEIRAELDEETARKAQLAALQAELARQAQLRSFQEKALEQARRVNQQIEEQRKLVAALGRQLETANHELKLLETRLAERQTERDEYTEIASRAVEIQAAFASWQIMQTELASFDLLAEQFRAQERQRQAPLMEIEAERARLAQELEMLQERERYFESAAAELTGLDAEYHTLAGQVLQLEAQVAQRTELEHTLQGIHQRAIEAQIENDRLKAEMDEITEHISQLEAHTGSLCPFCGQPLNEADRQALIAKLKAEGSSKGDRYRANQALLRSLNEELAGSRESLAALQRVDGDLRARQRQLDQLTSRQRLLDSQQAEWQATGPARLQAVSDALAAGTFALAARARLAEIDDQLKEIGYDAAAHDRVRNAEAAARFSADELRTLERAQAALAPLEREINDLRQQSATQSDELDRQTTEYEQAVAALGEIEADIPDLPAAEAELLYLQEQENRLRMQVGAAEQKVLVLDDLKTRRLALQSNRTELSLQVGRYKQLERAFGKDGVPALLIEQALPFIELRANEILGRLSDDQMSVTFVTQSAYKDHKREDLRETLDIQISDGDGPRDYELYSGGEAFRVNFAIRLALSEVLAQRAGARLQTLVIDEGFGSQDAQGRQRLVEAINLVRADFAKILVITHIDELKDYFPVRIEVQKTAAGSQIAIL
jgi:DNA repair protein SbcC/Rad50